MTTTHKAQVSVVAPTPGCAHVLAKRKAEKAGIFSFYSGKKQRLSFFLSCRKFSKHKNRVQCQATKIEWQISPNHTHINQMEVSKKTAASSSFIWMSSTASAGSRDTLWPETCAEKMGGLWCWNFTFCGLFIWCIWVNRLFKKNCWQTHGINFQESGEELTKQLLHELSVILIASRWIHFLFFIFLKSVTVSYVKGIPV